MDSIESVAEGQATSASSPDVAEITTETIMSAEETKPTSKYAAKKLATVEAIKNAFKVQNNKSVSLEDKKLHKKVSRNLLLSMRNECATVVCETTGIVSILNIPSIPGKVLTWGSPLASLSNARGIVQEGYIYLNRLDTQIIAGLFITIASEYDLIRTMVDQSGAVTNAILRTASKEKLIQACLLVETYIHSLNHAYQPKLSLTYDADLKDLGLEPRLTEWMKLVEKAIEQPDKEEYDENAVGFKPMKSIKDLKAEHSARVKEEKKSSSVKDKNYKERAAFRKDMKEAKNLISGLKETLSFKLHSFLKQLFTEESYLSVDKALLGQVAVKLQAYEADSAKKLIAIIEINRDALRAEISIDDLDDPLMAVVEASETEQTAEEEAEESSEAEHSEIVQFAGEFSSDVHEDKMPAGLSFSEKIKWKRAHGV